MKTQPQVKYDFPLKDLQRFMGMVNCYHRFLPKMAQTLAPLTDLILPRISK
jgi:hypothetical protein